mmetsp:Transcript_18040/g.39406  ORF Transcript_18040/g.39406 Transcript_18040/m.39406 type:complete len:245 (+) Transcript_18040:158-892(+)
MDLDGHSLHLLGRSLGGLEAGVVAAGGLLLRQLGEHVGDGVLTVHVVVPRAHVHRPLLRLLLAHHQYVVVLRELRLADLLLHLLVGEVAVHMEARLPAHRLHRQRVLGGVVGDGHDHDLAGGEPEGPFPGEVLGEDGDHALHAAHDGAVDDHGLGRPLLRRVGEVEADGELEVELDGGALESPPQRVEYGDVDLGPVEGAVRRVQLPLAPRLVEGVLERGLRFVPQLELPKVPLWSRGERHLVL